MTNTLPPAHWAADPSGRHEYRYWDGVLWTDHVADQGVQGIDAIEGGSPVTAQGAATTSDPTPDPAPDPALTPTPTPAAPLPPSTTADVPLPPSTTADAPVADEWPPGPPVVIPPPPPVPGTGLAGPGGLARGWSPWHSLDGLRTALIVLFVAGGVIAVAIFVTALNRISVIDDFERGSGSVTALRDANDAVDGVAAAQSVVLIATIVVFIIWQFRCAKNVEALGRDSAKFGPGWSIGGWFIPLANFVIPVMIFQGFWRATAPGSRRGSAWTDGKGSALVGWWWGLFLLSNISGFAFGENQTREEVKSADTSAAVGSVLRVVAVVLAILVVVHLTRRFNERREESAAPVAT